ncbi:MAG: preprotein translocase subunit SecY [Candidatus Vogelbacteria bacterium RIFOXYD1_FULL_44_32]|uniref:Protein translocase subunit SecY n=1 Tax=Candidatus Vogelbacteria bacterium RIFOXYD1_FULL_44_32 TaxID=1802438 RepID=A0A1G2QE41_9BACT|nr:MAG: preprotein translocase subunit SecY [Candidatus Vogelbacteria bacterium RIFOXYD1_FULL_44_32]
MDNLLQKIKLVLADRGLVRRIMFVLGILAIFRATAAIPIPSVDQAALAQFFTNNQFFGLLNIFSGGGMSNLSIVMLGVSPFITGSIIIQLLTLVFPQLKDMYQEQGEAGRRKMSQYSRLLAVPLAVFQGFGLHVILSQQGIINNLTWFDQALSILVVTAGSIFLMWLGELINEYGIGNGVSMIIFAGIVSSLPGSLSQLVTTYDASMIPTYIGFIVLAIVIIGGVVIITEGERPIPVTYAKRVRGMKVYGGTSTYLPIRVNNAGVMPIIFALSILLFPQMIVNFLARVQNLAVQDISRVITSFLENAWIYGLFYFILVFGFTYFYSAVTFDPHQIAGNLQKGGAFIPGVRPGDPTEMYIGRMLSRLTFFGALFLGVVALLPLVMQEITGIQTLAIGGTSLLIVVSVILDLIKKIDAQVTMREY